MRKEIEHLHIENEIKSAYETYAYILKEVFSFRPLNAPENEKIKSSVLENCCSNLLEYAKWREYILSPENKEYDLRYLLKLYNEHNYLRFLDEILGFMLTNLIPKMEESLLINPDLKAKMDTYEDRLNKFMALTYEKEEQNKIGLIGIYLNKIGSENLKKKVNSAVEEILTTKNRICCLKTLGKIFNVLHSLEIILRDCNDGKTGLKISLDNIDISIL